jgi:hypothetical protein
VRLLHLPAFNCSTVSLVANDPINACDGTDEELTFDLLFTAPYVTRTTFSARVLGVSSARCSAGACAAYGPVWLCMSPDCQVCCNIIATTVPAMTTQRRWMALRAARPSLSAAGVLTARCGLAASTRLR